jgi:DNA-binding GntR family transcriptional regulator
MPLSVATLVRRLALSAATVRAALRQLEVAGLVEPAGKRTQGQTYRAIPGARHD